MLLVRHESELQNKLFCGKIVVKGTPINNKVKVMFDWGRF